MLCIFCVVEGSVSCRRVGLFCIFSIWLLLIFAMFFPLAFFEMFLLCLFSIEIYTISSDSISLSASSVVKSIDAMFFEIFYLIVVFVNMLTQEFFFACSHDVCAVHS